MFRLDRRVVAIAGAGLLVIAATLIIVFAAIVPVPEFDPLRPGEETGSVAYFAGDDYQSRSLRIMALDTVETVEVEVGREVGLAGWDSDGNLVVVDWESGGRRLFIDPETGEQVGSDPESGPDQVPQNQASVHHEDGRIVLQQPRGGATASFIAPDSYDIWFAVAMGEERIAFVDELGRVAVTRLGEDVEPVLVASGASEWAELAARP